MSPALVGGFLTTVPPGKPSRCIFMNALFLVISHDYVKLPLCFISQAVSLDVFELGANLQAVGAHQWEVPPALALLST